MTKYPDHLSADLMDIQSEPRLHCYLCGAAGNPLYQGLRDRLYAAPGEWGFRRCRNVACGFVWLDPMPLPSEIWKAYIHYYTHGSDSEGQRSSNLRVRLLTLMKRVYRVALRLTPFYYARRRLAHMYLDGVRPGRLLEVGCGSGERLALLRSQGWEVIGQEVDASAAQHARDRHGVEVRVGTLDTIGLSEASFDVVVANHVIEHVPDPVGLLVACNRLLKDGGKLIVVTPNIESYGRRHFGQAWRGLEPPRHLYLFSPRTLLAAAVKAGIAGGHCETSAANAEIVAAGSYDILAGGHHCLGMTSRFSHRIRAFLFQWRAWFAWLLSPGSGEECVLRAKKGGATVIHAR